MIDYTEALRIVLEATPAPTGAERVPLAAALGRALAGPIAPDVDLPPFAKAAMDGFAVRAADLARLPATLPVVGTVPAGRALGRALAAGEAAAVMTGAPIPDGADAVVQVEWTSGFGAPTVVVERAVAAGENVSPRGDVFRAGAPLLAAGAAIGPEEIALLASAGCDPVPVRPLPTVALLATGDELVPATAVPGPTQIRNSNGPALAAFCRGIGIEPDLVEAVPDDPGALRAAVGRGLARDVLLLTGGVSEGAFDFVEAALAAQGVDVRFRRVAIKPGKPTVFGTRGAASVFGLPGNPSSALTVARLLVAPALRRRAGFADPGPRRLRARLAEPIRKKPDRAWFLRGALAGGDPLAVRPLADRGAADVVGATAGDCLIHAPRGEALLAAGSAVEVIVWGGRP